jgi:hypothetical protein
MVAKAFVEMNTAFGVMSAGDVDSLLLVWALSVPGGAGPLSVD